MKRIILTAFTAALMAGAAACSSMRMTSEEKAVMAADIQSMIDNRAYSINVDRAIPSRGGNVTLTGSYDLKISGDSVYSYLPYFGRAYSLPYGGGEGLIFKGVMSDYSHSKGKKGANRIAFTVRTQEDVYTFDLDIFTNGSASIIVGPGNKSPITFQGNVDLTKNK